MKKILLSIISFYRASSSAAQGLFPWLSPCVFEPSCSHYVETALRKHTIVSALKLGLKRLIRCHPFQKGGWDPVPPSSSL